MSEVISHWLGMLRSRWESRREGTVTVLPTGWRALRGRQQGQTLVIVIFAFIGILAFVGLGVDLGLVYVERVRVARAADAAALAGASELPLEGTAQERAKVYLQGNGYDHTNTSEVRLVIDGNHVSGPPEDDASTVIWIDTLYSRDTSVPPAQQASTANRIRVRVQQQVFMTFMQFIGFHHFPVEALAEAESINNLDVVIVYDKSGSMEYDTLCYGCWEPDADEMYPNGDIYPLHWSDSTMASADHCANACGDHGDGDYDSYNAYYEVNDCNYHRYGTNNYYIVIEAEEYSSLEESADYHTWGFTPYKTFWVVQRNEYNYYHSRNVGAMGRDSRGAYLSHHPYAEHGSTSGLGVACTWDDLTNGELCRSGVPGGPFPAPRADYEFVAPRDDDYYIWIQGQGGSDNGNQHIFWGIDSAPRGQDSGFDNGAQYDGARDYSWDWRYLGRVDNLVRGSTHTLNLWAGGAGFDVDRIVITTDNSSPLPSTMTSGGTPPNNGRTDWACHECDPRFAGRPGGHEPTVDEPYYRPDCDFGANPDQRRDAIYDDEQPIRGALEAANHFVARLDPGLDQIGYVRYNDEVVYYDEPHREDDDVVELQCVRRLGAGCTAQVITDTVLAELDSTRAGGATNIAEGMEFGIDVLSTGDCVADGHCGRPGAAHIMVLMTDGQANTYPDCYQMWGACRTECDCIGEEDCCCEEDLWDGGPGEGYPCANDCVMYYAQEARDNAIAIYTISLGYSADRELMEEVANLTGGYHRWAPTRDKLDDIFDELYESIFLRLIQ